MAFFRKKASKIDKIEREATANAVEIRNLAVEYDTSKATVKAVRIPCMLSTRTRSMRSPVLWAITSWAFWMCWTAASDVSRTHMT